MTDREEKMEKRISQMNFIIESLREQNKELSTKYNELLDAYTDLVEEMYEL